MDLFLETINSEKQLEDTLEHMLNPTDEEYIIPSKKKNVHLNFLKCPKCQDGHMVLRDGQNGYFGGCSKFPKCNGTMYADKVVYESIKALGFNFYKWDTQCWKCGKPIAMYGYFPMFEYSFLEDIFDFTNCRLGNIEKIDKYLENKYPSIQFKYSKKGRISYIANICPHKYCKQLQGGKYKLKDMEKWLMSLTKEEREQHVVEKIPVGELLSLREWKGYTVPIEGK